MTRSRYKGGYPAHRIAQARSARTANAERIEALRAQSGEQAPIVTERFLTALRDIKLHLTDVEEPLPPAAPYRQLAEAIMRVHKSGQSESVLCWPATNLSVAAGFALSVIATWYDCDPYPSGDGLCAPEEFRALYYPWSVRTRLPLSSVYVSRDQVHRVHLRHMQRCGAKGAIDGMSDLHVTLIRVKDLNGRARDGTKHLELLHPALYEMIPTSPLSSRTHGQRTELLDRIRSKTQLKFLSAAQLADDPADAPYYLFGAGAQTNLATDLAQPPPGIRIVLLDLTRTGRGRFADDWSIAINRLIAVARSRLPGIPILAVTDDPWVHQDMTWRHLKKHSGDTHQRPAPGSAILATDRLIAAPAQPPVDYTGCETIAARGFAGQLDPLIDRITQLKNRASKIDDAPAGALLADLIALLKRSANLPGSVNHLGSYVVAEAGELAAINIMAAYQAPKLLSSIECLEGPLAQSRRGPLIDLCRDARALWNSQCQATPMTGLLVDVLKPFLRNSSKTVVLFRKQMLSDYAQASLVDHPEIGEQVSKRLANSMLRFVDAIGFRETTALPPRERHQTNTVIVVSPTRQQVLSMMADPWLPADVIILADARTLGAIARDAHFLAGLPAFAPFADRLRKLKTCAQSAFESVIGSKVMLTADAPPPSDTDFPTTRLIDLSGTGRNGSEILVRLETDDSQTILARQRTRLVAFDDNSAVPTYRPLTANDAHIGDAICVISDDFVDMARSKLDISHVASEEMRAYHHLVHGLYAKVPGNTDRTKREHLATLINNLRKHPSDPEVSPDNIRYWTDLEEQLAMALEEVVPHAPQQWSTFERFMTALGVSASLAERYWNWAVIHTRSNRLQAAHRLHNAYLGILISPHAAEADNPKRIADIRALRAAAESFVARIRNKTTIERASLCA